MTRRDSYREWAARILLTVFAAMLTVTSLHHHQPVPPTAEECADCTQHHAHPGHLNQGVKSIHDCLICQLTGVPFTRTAAPGIAARTTECITITNEYTGSIEGVYYLFSPLRAPPVIG